MEEIKEDKDKSPLPTPEPNKPEEQPQPDPEKSEENPQEQIDYKAEWEKSQEEAKKKDTKLVHAGEKIEKLRAILKENGLEDSEKESVSPEALAEIVKTEVAKATQETEKRFTTTVAEMFKSFTSKANKSQPGGSGQKMPVKEEIPTPSPADQKLIERYGLVYDPNQKLWVSPELEKIKKSGMRIEKNIVN